jgi:hypothetical protein
MVSLKIHVGGAPVASGICGSPEILYVIAGEVNQMRDTTAEEAYRTMV